MRVIEIWRQKMERKSCFFIGHREADEGVLPRLRETVERLISEENVGFFYVGATVDLTGWQLMR